MVESVVLEVYSDLRTLSRHHHHLPQLGCASGSVRELFGPLRRAAKDVVGEVGCDLALEPQAPDGNFA